MNQYKFAWKGKDPQGNVRSVEVMAENAQAAREDLTRRGWTELELLFDEIASAGRARHTVRAASLKRGCEPARTE